MRQAVLYLFVVLGSIGIAGTLDVDEYMDLLKRTCFLSAVASLVLLAVSPSVARSLVDFQGIFSHKNVLGQVMAAGALASFHVIRVDRRRRVRNILMLFVFIGMAFASASATACLAVFAICCANGIIVLFQRGGAALLIGIFLVLVLVPILVVIAVYPDPIFEMIGKDPTLTGRTDLWTYVINDISLKPLLGWGYFGFWSPNNPAAFEIADAFRIFLSQAHNGLLEMLLNVGVVGTAIFIFLFVRNVILAFRCLHTSPKALAISTITVCVAILTIGASEAVLLAANQPWTSMFFITGLMCEQAVRAANGDNIGKRRGAIREAVRFIPRPEFPETHCPPSEKYQLELYTLGYDCNVIGFARRVGHDDLQFWSTNIRSRSRRRSRDSVRSLSP